ncbi:unnamed protein product [Protopolystoma xenopodis]|uniref:Uncharacterized protein n=1 Tax=Protopolystoma xenopodis TaxID=117903 RepID=A0A448XJQ5_9PLAT|nr:unnamed protein product [Protopolystoma xenopodis]
MLVLLVFRGEEVGRNVEWGEHYIEAGLQSRLSVHLSRLRGESFPSLRGQTFRLPTARGPTRMSSRCQAEASRHPSLCEGVQKSTKKTPACANCEQHSGRLCTPNPGVQTHSPIMGLTRQDWYSPHLAVGSTHSIWTRLATICPKDAASAEFGVKGDCIKMHKNA